MWTLGELSDRVADALAVDYDGQPSGRVREVPNGRTIRWYTTIGLVDRPAGMRGRTAMYTRRHLLQLVAVKRLQAAGRTLTDIQSELVGATEDTLERVALLPRARFWATAPAAASNSEDVDTVINPAVSRVHGIRLNDTVTVLLDLGRALTDDEIAAVESAAAPMLDLLHRLGLNEGETR